MAKTKENSPLLGYNTNVRHAGKLFHIQTEDSGIEHPHVITHLFSDGTILATKKTSYADLVTKEDRESRIRQLMKEQHKAMFLELRDGAHDEIACRIFGASFAARLEDSKKRSKEQPIAEPEVLIEAQENAAPKVAARLSGLPQDGHVRIIPPAQMTERPRPRRTSKKPSLLPPRQSIFATPNSDGEFGDDLISDKSLDEVILSYMVDELEK